MPLRVSLAALVRDLAIVTFDVDPKAAARFAGPAVELRTVPIRGRPRALVSIVALHQSRIRPLPLPALPTPGFGQVNHRVSVRRGDESGVWFLSSDIGNRPAAIAVERAWRMGWRHAQVDVRADWDGQHCGAYRAEVSGGWGQTRLELVGSGGPPASLAGFESVEEGLTVMAHPLVGWYAPRPGETAVYRVRHARLTPETGTAVSWRSELLERRNLVEPGTQPHSVLLVHEAEFVTVLPPSPA